MAQKIDMPVARTATVASTKQGARRWTTLRLSRACKLVALGLLLAAAGLRWGIAPAAELLPPNYGSTLTYSVTMSSRGAPTSPVEVTQTVMRRRDQMLQSDGHALIQADARWMAASGKVIFQVQSIYGVDRRTRANISGYGDADREGQYLLPPHTRLGRYILWDSNYGGPVQIAYDHQEKFRGLDVAVFRSAANGIDESAGYATTPGVPAIYRAVTYGHGLLRIEPVSGVLVDHQDEGVTYFVERSTGHLVGSPLNQWTQRYAPATIEAQLRRAKASRRLILVLEKWLPLACAVLGIVAFLGGCRIMRARA
jgi:hypothetical protein